MRNKTFTVEEADNALPLVRRIVADVVRSYRLLSEQAEAYKALRTVEDRTSETEERLNDLKRSMGSFSEEIESFVAELSEIGCEMKDLKSGTVDFPSRMDDRRVYLCYQLGEDRVESWHEITEGFAGRKPLPANILEE
jgi:hypothetical protein